MACSIEVGDDGIVRLGFSGDMTADEAEAMFSDFQPLMDAATEKEPSNTLVRRQKTTRYPASVRRLFAELNAFPQIGKVTVLRISRYGRVLAGFLLKASGRDNIRFFDTEDKALIWLKEES